MKQKEIIKLDEIQNKIFTIRGIQVMIDRDISSLYEVETRELNQAVKRNKERFPGAFCFQLTDEEFKNWKSQIVISNEDKMGLRRPPFAFTEQGVAMLSAVLRSETAIKMSIQIINAFVVMRRFMLQNAQVFQRLNTLENKQSTTDQKLEKVLNAIESRSIQPQQGIFFDGQVFDAYQFVSSIIRSAKKSIVLIDNYIDDTVLTLFTKRRKEVSLTILTKIVSKQMELDVRKFNEQYAPVFLKEFKNAHDRFLIIDETSVYHFGASLKDLGKKWFAFSKMEIGALELLEKVNGLV
ncbi:MAG: hypothetical protein ACD_79C00572G0003 [uncultured bacterium]|nr:MAG: hypothetical protein ACD_79C00572G0003 [uncultured bacterium]